MKKCPICKAETEVFAEFKNQIVYRCTNCGFGFTSNLSAHFGEYHRDEVYIQEEKLFENIFMKRVKRIIQFKSSGEALDIGCSTGLMLSLFKRRGFNVLGVEISKKAAEIAEKRGLKVITKPFEDIKFEKKFDVIIINHTLEHLENPFFAIEKSSKLLNKGGIFYIDLPNFASLSAMLRKKDWPHLLVEEHLWHFTKESLEILLKKNKLKTIFVERASGVWDLDKPYLDLFRSLIGIKKRFLYNFLTLLPTLFLSKLNLGTDLMVIARKND